MIALKPLLTPACRHRIKKIIKLSSGIIILAIVIGNKPSPLKT